MNREETKKAIEVMQAYVDGKQIESAQEGCEWRASSPEWDWRLNHYRVKPEQRTVWVACSEFSISDLTWQTKEECDKRYPDHTWKTVKFVEVIE